MKKSSIKIAICLTFLFCVTIMLVSCANKKETVDSGAELTEADDAAASETDGEPEGTTTEEEGTADAALYQTEVVTDADGEPVTDENGNAVTEIVTDENGDAVPLTNITGESETTEEPEGTTAEAEETEAPTSTTPAATTTPGTTTTQSTDGYTYTALNQTMYVKSSVNVRSTPDSGGTKLGSLNAGQSVTVTGQCNETGWYRISYNGSTGYVSNNYLTTTKPSETTTTQQATTKQAETTTKTQTTYTFSEANETLIVVLRSAPLWSTAADAAEFELSPIVENITKETQVTLTGTCKEMSTMYRVKYNGTTYYTLNGYYMTYEQYEAKQAEYEAEQESIRIANLPTLCKEMLTLVNELRAENGVDPLIWCEEMEEGTLIRAEELAVSYSHTRPNGEEHRTVFNDILHVIGEPVETGFLFSTAENIIGTASWTWTAEEAFESWCNSEGHLENMLSARYTYFCCAYSYGGSFWVQEFGVANENYTE